MTSNTPENLEDSHSKEFLEIKKIELEIRQLNQSYFKKNIAPSLIQAFLGLIVALISILFVYKSNLYDGKEKLIDAKTKYNETVLKNIEQAKVSDKLDSEIKKFNLTKDSIESEINKMKKVSDSITFASGELNDNNLKLKSRISELTENKNRLQSKIDFAIIEYNLKQIKFYANPFTSTAFDLINELKLKSKFVKNIIDSLELFRAINQYNFCCNYILYKGTGYRVYFEQMLEDIRSNRFNFVKDSCNLYFETPILISANWTDRERQEISNQIIITCKDSISECAKTFLLDVIKQYSYIPSFSLKTDNQFFDYLKLNRDIFTKETLFDEVQRIAAYQNIKCYSVQLYYALAIYYGSLNARETNLPYNVILQSMGTVFYTSNTIANYRDDFYRLNKLDDNLRSREKIVEYYNSNKKKIDNWIFGNFDVFRKDTTVFKSIIINKTF